MGLWIGHATSSTVIKSIAQQDLMEANALFIQSDSALNHGDRASALSWCMEGTGELFSAITPLDDLGFHDVDGIAIYLQGAQWDFVHGKSSKRERKALQTFHQALSPFVKDNFGTIPDSALQHALNRIESVLPH